MSDLYSQLVKLAYEKRDVRPHILPLIREAKQDRYFQAKIAGRSWKVDVSQTSVEDAKQFAGMRFADHDMSLKEVWPNFEENYRLLRSKMGKAKDVPRIQMPVIEPEDMDLFHEKLNKGKLDIFAPYAKGHFYAPDSFDSKEDAEEWVQLGWEDGDPEGDVIRAKWTSAPAGDLIPTQGQIWFDKLVESAIEFGAITSGSPVLDMTIIASKEGYILDGHHRFAGTVLSDPSLAIKALYIPLGIDLLLEVGRSYGAAQGNEPKA